MKKLVSTLLIFMLTITLCACGGGKDGSSTSKNDSSKEATQQVSTSNNEEKEPVEEPPVEPEADIPEKTGNILLDAEFKVANVMNGSNTEKIGEYGYINVTKEDLKTVTEEQYSEFATTKVKDSGYNWVSIICNDGTGICFTGSMYFAGTYGQLDNEGCVTEGMGNITLQSDGSFKYEAY